MDTRKVMKNTILKPIKYLFIGLFCWFIIHSVYIVADGLTDKNTRADVAIVLGNKINEDGSLSKRLEARLNKSIELYNNKRVQYIIVSGGFGKEGFWEGKKMKDYLIENSIPENKIVVDDYGNNTEATVVNSLKIMKTSMEFGNFCITIFPSN